ncbi:hypothetical protein TNIN_53481 [Trichonephila inaurata madagascariensis]|uniref:Uncharacterized protein n=1 Tax=Trichonephila inaurata madagascariensis TaxID=2747483 RepID=A0A8X6YF29_9ARAC|nr:hypothetical protein TNIN_53481 [Trichonephila inaurata madagascariensis]
MWNFYLPLSGRQETRRHIFNTGIIASNFTNKLLALREAFMIYMPDSQAMDTPEELIILSDSKSALMAEERLTSTSSINYLIELMYYKGKFFFAKMDTCTRKSRKKLV